MTDFLKDLHWLPLCRRIDFKVLLLTYKALHEEAPRYLTDLLKWHQPKRELRSSNEKLLQVPKSKLKTYGDRSFEVVAPKLWNDLLRNIRDTTSTYSFKKNLKTHLYKMHYGLY